MYAQNYYKSIHDENAQALNELIDQLPLALQNKLGKHSARQRSRLVGLRCADSIIRTK